MSSISRLVSTALIKISLFDEQEELNKEEKRLIFVASFAMMRMRLGTSLPANVPTLLEKEKERNNRVVYRDIIRDCVHSVDIRGSGLISGRIAGARPPQTFYFRMIITLRKFDIRFSNIFSK